ncbi:MAG: ferritin family protein [bacterium]|nr:MAG: ferritin family protein [bacterium]
MDGGINAWKGLTADGPPEAGVAYFEAGESAADMAALAWALEDSTRLFYLALAGMRPGTGEADLFMKLVQAEEHHKETLAILHMDLSPEPVDRFVAGRQIIVLEGGMDMESALKWAEGRSAAQVLDLALGLESNAYDRYLKMLDAAPGDLAREVFRIIAAEEKEHLKKLSQLLDESAGA